MEAKDFWKIMPADRLPGFWEECGTIGEEGKEPKATLGRCAMGSALYIFTKIKHPDDDRTNITLVCSNKAIFEGGMEMFSELQGESS